VIPDVFGAGLRGHLHAIHVMTESPTPWVLFRGIEYLSW